MADTVNIVEDTEDNKVSTLTEMSRKLKRSALIKERMAYANEILAEWVLFLNIFGECSNSLYSV